nr:NTP transferase domain-containing protein [Armatimonas sp.]
MPAVVTAGGRLDGALAEATGQSVKALVALDGAPLLQRVLEALASSGVVRETVVVGPVAHLEPHVTHPNSLLAEGDSGIENLLRGLNAVNAGEGFALFAASDLPYLCADSVRWLVENAPEDADIVFPITDRQRYEARFPATPGAWTRLSDGELTGGSVFLMRPAAIARNRALLEKAFTARKSQWQMAQLLGLRFALKFATGRLSVADAVARATVLTGCRCKVLLDAHPHLACDLDTHEEWLYLKGLQTK